MLHYDLIKSYQKRSHLFAFYFSSTPYNSYSRLSVPPVPFSRQAVEAGSLQYYGAASAEPPSAELTAEDVSVYEAAVPVQAINTLPLGTAVFI